MDFFYLCSALFFALVISSSSAAAAAAATAKTDLLGVNYYVGNWTTASNYTLWSEGKTFYYGDTLTFTVRDADSVIRVPEDVYEGCNWTYPSPSRNSIIPGHEWNLTQVPAVGDNYYISPVEELCKSGLKLEVEVLPQAEAPSGHYYTPKNYTVGDNSGWSRGVDYSSWVSGKTFYFGDAFSFVFNASEHFVVEVVEEVYQSCNASYYFAESVPWLKNDKVMTLVPPVGDHYFVSPVGDDCDMGMKLELTILPTNQAFSPSLSSPSPSPASASFPAESSGSFLTASTGLIAALLIAAIL